MGVSVDKTAYKVMKLKPNNESTLSGIEGHGWSFMIRIESNRAIISSHSITGIQTVDMIPKTEDTIHYRVMNWVLELFWNWHIFFSLKNCVPLVAQLYLR